MTIIIYTWEFKSGFFLLNYDLTSNFALCTYHECAIITYGPCKRDIIHGGGCLYLPITLPFHATV